MINSDANKQSGLSKKVKIIKRSNLIKSNFAKWLKNQFSLVPKIE